MTQREKYLKKKKTYEKIKKKIKIVNYDWSRMKNATDLNELIHVVNKASWPLIVIFENKPSKFYGSGGQRIPRAVFFNISRSNC